MSLGKTAVGKNIIANFFGVGVQLISQILLVPLFLYFWTTDLYSDWITLSAVSLIFSISDVGVNSVSCNKFSMLYAQKKFIECRTILTNNYILLAIVSGTMVFISFIYVKEFNIVSNLGLRVLNQYQANYVFLVLVIMVFLGMMNSVLDAIYRACGKNHVALYLGNTCRLIEVVIIISSLILELPLTYMVSLYVVPKVLLFIYKIFDSKRLFSYQFKISQFDWHSLKEILGPSFSFMSFPAGNAIVLQGFTLVVNKFFGADSVILFNTTRTMCNFIKIFLASIQLSVWPEYSIACGKNDIIRMRQLHRKAVLSTIFLSVFSCIGVLILGPLVYTYWTRGAVPFSYSLMTSFLVILFFDSLWASSGVSLMATNKHFFIGFLYLILSCISILLAILVANNYLFLPALEYCLLVVYIPLSFVALRASLKMSDDKLFSLFNSLNMRDLLKKIRVHF